MPAVYNRSTVVSDDDVRKMVTACDTQMKRDFCPNHELAPWHLTFGGRAFIHFYVVDEDRDVPGALAYHDYDGRPVGVVLAKTCLEAGASVSSALSHEVLETRVDAFCNATHRNSDGWSYWREVCDAVQTVDRL